MAEAGLLHTPAPLTRPQSLQRRRMESFPTDDTSELNLNFGEGDGRGAVSGMPESVSLGAFPMFFLQDSPGDRKSIPLFPESPGSTYGFAPPVSRTIASQYFEGGVTGANLDCQRHRPSDSWDSQLSTPTRAPSYETRLLSTKPSFASEDDETLVGHGETVSNTKKLRPVMSFSSATSTELASPLSDVFSPGPGSTSCSVSTSTSTSSRRSPFPDEFPTEVGGMVSLELEEPDRILFTKLSEESASSISLPVDTNPSLSPETKSRLSVHTPPRPRLVHSHTPKSSPSSPINVHHRRAFSGARELLTPSSSSRGTSSLGRLRSCSVNSGPGPNDLIEQAAATRSRSASVSASAHGAASTGTHGATRSLNSMQSKESFRTKFANLPGYVTFLREITLEIWIDQEGFRAIRPQFELHRYTPGQLASVTSNLRLGASPKSPKTARPRTAQLPMTPPRRAGEELRRPSTSGSSPAGTDSAQQFLENWGVAEFTMKKRKGWNFHHGVVDGEPILRRLTINGVEDRDYLSREASLSVRSNGVYTVKGSEDRGKFSWKFEYLVEDRRGPTGAVLHGEKTFTPLSFTCSPELLIPEQGKKVGLLRVMKKSVAPKISSSKMDPVLIPPLSPNTSFNYVHKDKAKKFETFTNIVRHKPSKSPRRTPASFGPHRTVDRSENVTEDGRRRAASYSNMRPDLKQILGDGYDG